MSKKFTHILHKRIRKWIAVSNVLKENQSGFRAGRGTRDNIFALSSIIQLQLRLSQGNVYAAFVDIKRAFDSINYAKLWEKLYQTGISSKLIRILKNMYNAAKIPINDPIKLNAGVRYVNIERWVLQGEILSPTLFTLYKRSRKLF